MTYKPHYSLLNTHTHSNTHTETYIHYIIIDCVEPASWPHMKGVRNQCPYSLPLATSTTWYMEWDTIDATILFLWHATKPSSTARYWEHSIQLEGVGKAIYRICLRSKCMNYVRWMNRWVPLELTGYLFEYLIDKIVCFLFHRLICRSIFGGLCVHVLHLI